MDGSKSCLTIEKEESVRKKRGCQWNPLHLIGPGTFRFSSRKDLNVDREELQKRVVQIEKKLCYITEKINKCEHSKGDVTPRTTEEDHEAEEESDKRCSTDSNIESEEKLCSEKSSQNFMVLLKQHKMKKLGKELDKLTEKYDRLRESVDKRRKPSRDSKSSKSVVWNHIARSFENESDLKNNTEINHHNYGIRSSHEFRSPYNEFRRHNNDVKNHNDIKNKYTSWDSKSVNFDLLKHQNQITVQTALKMERDERGDEPKKPQDTPPTQKPIRTGSRIFSNEGVTKSNLKLIIDEAVVDSIGKTLQKYFKEGLEKYIKKRVESAVHTFKGVKSYTARTQTSFESYPAPKTMATESKYSVHDEIQTYQSTDLPLVFREEVNECSLRTTSEMPDDMFREDGNDCSIKSICSGITNFAMVSKTYIERPNKAIEKGAPITKYKSRDIQSWVNKRQRLKPVAAEVKTVFSVRTNESTKTLNILRSNTTKPLFSDRAYPRKLRRKRSGEELT